MDALPKRLALIGNQAFSLINFRGELIREMTRQGMVVYALAPDYDAVTRSNVAELGAIPLDYSMSRAGLNPFRDFIDVVKLTFLLRHLNVDASLGYCIKPVIYGTISAWLAGVRKRFAMIEGAGYVFIEDEKPSFRRSVLKKLVKVLYRLSLNYAHCVFLLNKDDRDLFIDEGMVDVKKVSILDGIGLDIRHFDLSPPMSDPVTFILVARLLREKGIFEYIDAAREVKRRHPSAKFLLVGNVDVNPGSINASQVEQWVRDGIVEWPGQVGDIRPWLKRSSVFVLPSYREGMPRSTQEAMSMGRPVITTDVPGCRDTVENGRNGFIIPPRESTALAHAMITFIERPELIAKMGRRSREIAVQRFDVNMINAQIIEVLSIY